MISVHFHCADESDVLFLTFPDTLLNEDKKDATWELLNAAHDLSQGNKTGIIIPSEVSVGYFKKEEDY